MVTVELGAAWTTVMFDPSTRIEDMISSSETDTAPYLFALIDFTTPAKSRSQP